MQNMRIVEEVHGEIFKTSENEKLFILQVTLRKP